MAEPKVRFRRDDGSSYSAWEQGRFGDLIEVYDEKVTSDCTLPVLTSSKTDGIQYQSDHFGREQLHDITGYNVIPRGYCTYRNRSDGTDFTFNINNLCDRGIVSKFYPVFHTTARCNLYFLMTLMNNEPKTVRKIAMTAKGTGQKVLSFLDLQKIEINIPSLEEQQKIADFLSSVDDVISTSEQEVANLETQKKAVMKKIFSQEVRFKRADGSDFPEWEEHRLGDFGVFVRGLSYGKDDVLPVEDGTLVLRSNNILEDRSLDYRNGLQFVKKMPKREQMLQKGDIVICMANGSTKLVGKAGKYDGNYSGTITVGAFCGIYRCDLPIAPYVFQAPDYIGFLTLNAQGGDGAIANLKGEDILNFETYFPCLEEQHLIADFLSNFDEAIEMAKKELELWKKLKKGLLKQMFV